MSDVQNAAKCAASCLKGNQQPTIEQNSCFSAKTKEGQDVEFVATLRFYVSPTGEVKINAPGAATPSPQPPPTEGTRPGFGYYSTTDDLTLKTEEKSTVVSGTIEKETVLKETVEVEKKPEQSKTIVLSPTEPSEPTKPSTSIAPPAPPKPPPRDESLDKHFPRGPPNDCPIIQFIPDPCRAIDDIQKSIKGILSGFFGRDCPPPPPQNTDNIIVRPKAFGRSEVGEHSIPSTDDPKENKTESEAMKNEEKYEI